MSLPERILNSLATLSTNYRKNIVKIPVEKFAKKIEQINHKHTSILTWEIGKNLRTIKIARFYSLPINIATVFYKAVRGSGCQADLDLHPGFAFTRCVISVKISRFLFTY